MTLLQSFQQGFADVAKENHLLAEAVQVQVKPLTAKQAIGLPERQDFPIQKGKERILEARFKGSAGQAFTDSFRDYEGKISDLIELDLSDRFNASVFCAAANAVLRHLNMVRGTIHCRDQEPSQCAPKLIEHLAKNHPGIKKVALVGLQPAMCEALAERYELQVLDLDPDNIGQKKAGAFIRDGHKELREVVKQSDLIVATGSTLGNNTIDKVLAAAGQRPVVFFGITISGAAELLGLERFCPLGH
jgi:uncharacterized protein (DUF4213/DUF364 family)